MLVSLGQPLQRLLTSLRNAPRNATGRIPKKPFSYFPQKVGNQKGQCKKHPSNLSTRQKRGRVHIWACPSISRSLLHRAANTDQFPWHPCQRQVKHILTTQEQRILGLTPSRDKEGICTFTVKLELVCTRHRGARGQDPCWSASAVQTVRCWMVEDEPPLVQGSAAVLPSSRSATPPEAAGWLSSQTRSPADQGISGTE